MSEPPRNGVRWPRKATPSLNSISGSCTWTGTAFRRTTPKPSNWFRRAAEQDYTQAQHNLGAMYGSGQGVKRDYVQAYKWLNICAAKGNAGCITQRDLIAKKLKPGQVTEAQRLSTDFKPQKESEKQ